MAVKFDLGCLDADRVVQEFVKIAFANARDFLPRKGEEFDLHRLNSDLTAAIDNVEQEEVVDRRTGDTRRRLRLKLFDKVSALNALARHLGLFSDRHCVEGTLEYRIQQLSPEERIERVRQLRDKARREYLPRYEQDLKTIDSAAQQVNDHG